MLILYNAGTRIGRLKVIFRLPKTLPYGQGVPWSTEPQAYVEWYTAPNLTDGTHNMHSVRTVPTRGNGLVSASIVPLANIRQTCQLIPKYGHPSADQPFTTHDVLDKCQSFLVNNWAGLYAYQTIW